MTLNEFGLGRSKLGPQAAQHIKEFHELFDEIAGIYPGGPSVPIDKIEAAWQRAVRIKGFDPMHWLW